MKQSVKYILLSLGLMSLGVASYFGYTLWRVLSIGTAYQAKQFCSVEPLPALKRRGFW